MFWLLVPVMALHCMINFNGYIIYVLRQVGEKVTWSFLRYFWATYYVCFLAAYEQADTQFWAIMLNAIIMLSTHSFEQKVLPLAQE